MQKGLESDDERRERARVVQRKSFFARQRDEFERAEKMRREDESRAQRMKEEKRAAWFDEQRWRKEQLRREQQLSEVLR